VTICHLPFCQNAKRKWQFGKWQNRTFLNYLTIMEKKCAKCGVCFEARSNQFYCSSSCKLRSFQEKRTSAGNADLGVISSSRSYAPARGSKESGKITLEIEKLRLQHEEKLKKLDMEAQERQHIFELRQRQSQLQQEYELASLEKEGAERERKEHLELEGKLADVERRLSKLSTDPEAVEEPIESEEKVESGLGWILGIVGGAILLNAMAKKGRSGQLSSSKNGLAGDKTV